MNERIKELAEQADIKFDKDINEIDVCVLLPSDLEKFAELLVKECITTIEQDRFRKANELDTEYDEGYVDGMGRAERILKEHFGVNK
jgi:hypothetical protein